MGTNNAKLSGEHELHKSLIQSLKNLRVIRMEQKTNLLFPQKNDNQKAMREQMIDWDSWRKRAGVSFHWTPHTFRHTALTNLFNNSANPQAVICKQYRVSLQVALSVYVKVTRESRLAMRDSIQVNI